jgi:hypothetical protein
MAAIGFVGSRLLEDGRVRIDGWLAIVRGIESASRSR